jgi:hypothetical protein
MEDVRSYLSQPCVGSAETMAAPFWRTLGDVAPDARVVVVRRPVEAVVDSLMRLQGCQFDAPALTRAMRRLDAKLDQVQRRVRNVLTVSFEDLATEDACQRVFEHCLPYRHDHEWWSRASAANLQTDMRAMTRYVTANLPQLERLAKAVKQQTLPKMALRPAVERDGITIGLESVETWFRDAQHLFREHLVAVGEDADNAATKNVPLMSALEGLGGLQIVTARCNGRMFGYLMAVIGPSFEARNVTSAVHTIFYASPEFPGLGLKLQRASLAALKERGVDEVFLRAGPRGSGPRLPILYQRLGAVPDGEQFRLTLTER